MRKIIRVVDIHSKRLNDEFNITMPQLICLYSLVRTEQMTQSELSKYVSMGASTVNGIIDRLENKGLLLRQRDAKDRRKVFITVTEEGKKLTESAPSLLQDHLLESLRTIPELEQAAIALSLEKIVKLMEEANIDVSEDFVSDRRTDHKQEKEIKCP
jgi:DNA-binding MarR family transcriptional regulator